jgi:hypothetical protein
MRSNFIGFFPFQGSRRKAASFQELSRKNTFYLQAKNKEGFFALELAPRTLKRMVHPHTNLL